MSDCNEVCKYYYHSACQAHLDGIQLRLQLQDQSKTIAALQDKLKKCEERQTQLEVSNVRRQLAINIETEIKLDYMLACSSRVLAKHNVSKQQRYGSTLRKYDIFQIRSWVQDRATRKRLDRKWHFKHTKDISLFKKCMHNMKEFTKLAHSTKLDQKEVDFTKCCNLILESPHSDTLERTIQYVSRLNEARKKQNARYFLYN